MFSNGPLRSLENHYAKQERREHNKAQRNFAEGDVEKYHKHEHRAHRAARHASAIRTMSGSFDKENRGGTMSGFRGGSAYGSGYGLGVTAGVPPLQSIAPQQPQMYVVPQLQVIPLAPIIIDEIQSAPSMTSLTSSPFGQNVLLGGPMDFPAATSFSSDQGCGLPPMTYSRSFDAPLDANTSAAAMTDLQAKLIDREARLYEVEQQRSFDQAELTQLRAQIDSLRRQVAGEANKFMPNRRSNNEPLTPSSGLSSSDSEDDGLGDNDGSIRRPLNLNTHVFPLVEEGSFALPNSMSLNEGVESPIYPVNGLPDGGLAQAVLCPRNLPPRVRTWEIPFVPSMELPSGSIGGPAMMQGFGSAVNDDDDGQTEAQPQPQAPLSASNSQQFLNAQTQDPQYLVSPSGECFDGLEVTSRDVGGEPASGGPYQRLLLPQNDENQNVERQVNDSVVAEEQGMGMGMGASSSSLSGLDDPFAPPPIEISRAESEHIEADYPHQRGNRPTLQRQVVHQHHLKHLNQPQQQQANPHPQHLSTAAAGAKAAAPRAAPTTTTKRPTNVMTSATAATSGGVKRTDSNPQMAKKENEKVKRIEKENSAESEILHYKTSKTPPNTVTTSASGASAPLRTL